jgi:peptidoglycan/LPS O-acetylase OafA/YrhL
LENIPSSLSFNSVTLKETGYYLLLVFSLPFLFNYTKKNNFDMVLGSLSYPVYISHMFFYYILLNTLPFAHDSSEFAIGLVTASILGSLLLVRCIDTPVERFRQKRLQSHNDVENNSVEQKIE